LRLVSGHRAFLELREMTNSGSVDLLREPAAQKSTRFALNSSKPNFAFAEDKCLNLLAFAREQ